MTENNDNKGQEKKNPLKEITQPFIDLIHAPRALMGINVSYFFEGLVYFGVLTVLGKYMSENVGLSDQWAGLIMSFFTAGITLAMLFLGGVGDKIGIRKALLLALGLMVLGRVFLSISSMEQFFTAEEGLGSPMFWMLSFGLLIVVVGYGMYQPTSYAGIKKFTDEKTATMGYAVIYALMNLGAFVSGIISPPIRQSLGIGAVYWVYTILTFLAVLAVFVILTQKTEDKTAQMFKEAQAKKKKEESESTPDDDSAAKEDEPKPQWTGQRAALLIASFVMAILCAVGFIYGYNTRDRLTADEGLSTIIEKNQETVKILSKIEPKEGEDPPAELASLGEALDKLQSLSSQTRIDLESKEEEFDGTLDSTAMSCLRLFLDGQERYVNEMRTASEKILKLDADKTILGSLNDALRAHALFGMTLAYSMVAEVDKDIVERLRKRFSQPGEEIIPMPDELKSLAVSVAQQELWQKLQAYQQNADDLANAITDAVPDGALGPIALLIAENGRFSGEAALLLKETSSESASEIITAKLLADADYALKTGVSLAPLETEAGFMESIEEAVKNALDWIKGIFVDKEEEKKSFDSNLTYLSSSIKALQNTTKEMQDKLGLVYQVPLGARVLGFLASFGAWIVGIILFALAGIMIFLKVRPDHPFNNGPFVFFVFILIPVQTLFAHNWLTLPYYINRSFGGTWVGDWFEFFTNINPLLIFILAPLVAALTAKANVFKMMIVGSLVMAAPTFLLALPPNPILLLSYILIMSIGEAIWQPRFLQYVAELAPEGKTGIYMGIAQFPWFMTKMVTGFYSGWFLSNFIPQMGPQNPQTLWFIYGLIAMISPVALLMTARWIQSGIIKSKK